MSKVRTLVIDRTKWLRGDLRPIFGDDVYSRLRDQNGRMCCLGFYLKACGARGLTSDSAYAPSDLARLPAEAAWLKHPEDECEDGPAEKLISANDFSGRNEADREKKIAKLFREHGGVTVTFRGRTPKAADTKGPAK